MYAQWYAKKCTLAGKMLVRQNSYGHYTKYSKNLIQFYWLKHNIIAQATVWVASTPVLVLYSNNIFKIWLLSLIHCASIKLLSSVEAWFWVTNLRQVWILLLQQRLPLIHCDGCMYLMSDPNCMQWTFLIRAVWYIPKSKYSQLRITCYYAVVTDLKIQVMLLLLSGSSGWIMKSPRSLPWAVKMCYHLATN